ncbi:MAG: hypothetical protein KJ893_04265 [Candidatus Omnitrophica bacterium]|nr:hypothetical protein [Candidatus Omnitrophota bacterium]
MEDNIMHTDLTFFTNENDSTLLQRFKVTLENNAQFFDVLVGYFRTSGFFQNFFAEGFVDNPYYNTAPREVILSEYLVGK